MSLDFGPLESEPSPADVEAVRDDAAQGRLGATTAAGARASRRRPAAVGAGVGGTFVVIGLLVLLVNAVKTSPGDDTATGAGLLVFGVVLGAAVRLAVRAVTARQWRQSTQLVLFARANGFTAEPFADVQPVPGVAGRRSSRAWTRQLLRWDVAGRPAHLATYHQGYNSGSTDCRYFAVELGGDLPAMSFRCGHNGPQLPETRFGPDVAVPTGSLRLGGLEDDGRARALFDDELVGLLTDRAHPTNAEVVDGWFIGYVTRLGRLGADGWRHAFAVADLVVRRSAQLSP